MSAPTTLTRRQARLLHLAAQGLLARPRKRAQRADLLAAIRRMQLLQIDTIHVVARSPYLVLFSRLGAFDPPWLDELLASGALFETWAHEACFTPIEDYPLHRARLETATGHWALRHAERMHCQQREGMDRVLAHVRAHGAVRSSDFDASTGSGGWWGWKDEKRWLEALFARGELMVARREKFQRVYDLSERVLDAAGVAPAARLATDAGMARWEFVLQSVQALGVVPARWIADYFRLGPRLEDAELDDLVSCGRLLRVSVESWPTPGYVHAANADLLLAAADDRLRATLTTLLSPFDPVVWHRERAAALFDFEYRLECYTPQAKRRYGYFVLPILRRGALVGRLDAKAHRQQGRFEVKQLFLEPGVAPSDALATDLARALRECAAWHRTPDVDVQHCEPRALSARLRAALK